MTNRNAVDEFARSVKGDWGGSQGAGSINPDTGQPYSEQDKEQNALMDAARKQLYEQQLSMAQTTDERNAITAKYYADLGDRARASGAAGYGGWQQANDTRNPQTLGTWVFENGKWVESQNRTIIGSQHAYDPAAVYRGVEPPTVTNTQERFVKGAPFPTQKSQYQPPESGITLTMRKELAKRQEIHPQIDWHNPADVASGVAFGNVQAVGGIPIVYNNAANNGKPAWDVLRNYGLTPQDVIPDTQSTSFNDPWFNKSEITMDYFNHNQPYSARLKDGVMVKANSPAEFLELARALFQYKDYLPKGDYQGVRDTINFATFLSDMETARKSDTPERQNYIRALEAQTVAKQTEIMVSRLNKFLPSYGGGHYVDGKEIPTIFDMSTEEGKKSIKNYINSLPDISPKKVEMNTLYNAIDTNEKNLPVGDLPIDSQIKNAQQEWINSIGDKLIVGWKIGR